MSVFEIILGALAIGGFFYSGELIVRSLSWIGRYTGISEYALSFVLVAFATSLPEFFVGITSAIEGVPAFSLGNVIGANVLDITLVLGVSVLVAGRLAIDHTIEREDLQLTLGLALFPALLVLDGVLSRADGVLLLLFFAGYVLYLFERHRAAASSEALASEEYHLGTFFRNIGIFLGGVAILLASSWVVVEAGIDGARAFGLPFFFVGVLAAFGTTLPELVFGAASAARGRGGMSFGNALGSIIANTTLIAGLVALLEPVAIENVADMLTGIGLVAAFIIIIQTTLFVRGALARPFGVALCIAAILFVWFSAP